MSHTEQASSDTGGASFDHCDKCNAPVDRDQRYCVNCGNHRRHVRDPAAKYIGQSGAGTGQWAGTAVALTEARPVVPAPAADRWGGLNLVGAFALALIPVAAVVGVAIGRSSNNQDSKLIAALEKQQAARTVVSTTAAPTAAASTDAGSGSTKSTKHDTKKSSTSKGSKKATTKSTSNGSVSNITGSKVTKSEQAAGTKAAQQIEKSTGKNYVQSSNDLPSTVVVGP